MSEPTDLKGRVAIVTGSSAGIGAAVVQAFANLGASVVVNSTSSVAAGQRVAEVLPDAIYVQADVSDPAQAERLVDAAVEQYGRLDIVVNNAGTTVVIPHHDLDAATNEIWERILRVNVLGAWNMTRAAAPHHIPFRGATAKQTAQMLLRDSGLMTGQVVLGGTQSACPT